MVDAWLLVHGAAEARAGDPHQGPPGQGVRRAQNSKHTKQQGGIPSTKNNIKAFDLKGTRLSHLSAFIELILLRTAKRMGHCCPILHMSCCPPALVVDYEGPAGVAQARVVLARLVARAEHLRVQLGGGVQLILTG